MKKLTLILAALITTVLLQGCGTSGAVPGSSSPSTTLDVNSGGADTVPTITYMGFAVVQQGKDYSAKIVVFFSEDMDQSTIIPANFVVKDADGNDVPGTMLYIGVTAVFTPNQRFQADASYSVTVETGVHSAGGIPLAKPKDWAFTTPDPSELTGVLVTVSAVAPAAYAMDVPVNSGVNVTFGQLMDPTTVNNSTVSVVAPDGTAVPGVVHYSGVTASFVPSAMMAPNTTYRLVVSNGVKSLSGVTMDQTYHSLFTTGTTVQAGPPSVIFDAPADGDTNVSLNGTVVVDFSQAMDTTTINTSNITLTDSYGRTVDGTVSYNGTAAVFTPDAPLSPLTQYTLNVNGNVASAGGVQMQDGYGFSFTTASFGSSPAPTVVFSSPTPNERDVSGYNAISVAFSQTMDPTSIDATTVQLTAPDGSLVPGTLSYLGNVISFTPSAPLGYGTYTMTLSGAITAADGSSLGSNYSWSFTTSMPM